MTKKTFLLFSFCIMLASCASKKDLIYLQNATGQDMVMQRYENTIQPDDNIVITVTSDQPELANPFNLIYLNIRSTNLTTVGSSGTDALVSYQVNQEGDINFPVLGKIKVAGLTRIQAEDKIKDLLKKELVNPGVVVKVINFKVSVFGEVLRPSTVTVPGDRITLLEALSMCGDLTIYGDRKEIQIIREKDGVKTINTVDITNADFVNSPFYYLCHNDAIYVKPNKTRVNSSVIGPNITVGISALSLIITIIALTVK